MAALGQPRFMDRAAFQVVGLAKRYPPDKLSLIPAQWADLRSQAAYVTGRVGGDAYGVWYDVLNGENVFTYVTGFVVGAFAPVHPALSRMRIVAQHYAVFAHTGPIGEIRQSMDSVLNDWLPKSGRQHARPDPAAPDFFERYGADFNPETGLGTVEIWLPIKR